MSITQTPLDSQPDPMAPHFVDDDELRVLLEDDHEEREADRRALPWFLIATSSVPSCLPSSRS